VSKPALSLPDGWRQGLGRGQGVLAELSVEAPALGAQALAEAALLGRKRNEFFFLDGPGRPPLMAGEPLFSFLARGRRGAWKGGGATEDLDQPPEEAFANLGRAYAACGLMEEQPGLSPLLGWLSYEAGGRFERLPLPSADPLSMPDWHLMLPGEWAWRDPLSRRWRFRLLLADRPFHERLQAALGLRHPGQGALTALKAEAMLDSWQARVAARLELAASLPETSALAAAPRRLEISDSFTSERYGAAVEKARAYIATGDVFQVNLAHRQSAPYQGAAWPLYRRLSQINPSPQACFADLGSYQIVSASPERFFSLQGGVVETHPIAGTIPRGEGGVEEASALLLSEKDRAEHVMTVDIERNDLSRVCKPGSVRVKDLMALESYSHLHHLVSRVQGELKEGMGPPEIFKAAFPGGSVTGAPKIRCMEIIAELEGERRGLYTGSLGFWDPIHATADFNLLIRTIFLGQGKAVWQVGAGIVADSEPRKEWEETLQKAAALKLALETAAP
jgi:para-aminobenzoate synthetase component 1